MEWKHVRQTWRTTRNPLEYIVDLIGEGYSELKADEDRIHFHSIFISPNDQSERFFGKVHLNLLEELQQISIESPFIVYIYRYLRPEATTILTRWTNELKALNRKQRKHDKVRKKLMYRTPVSKINEMLLNDPIQSNLIQKMNSLFSEWRPFLDAIRVGDESEWRYLLSIGHTKKEIKTYFDFLLEVSEADTGEAWLGSGGSNRGGGRKPLEKDKTDALLALLPLLEKFGKDVYKTEVTPEYAESEFRGTLKLLIYNYVIPPHLFHELHLIGKVRKAPFSVSDWAKAKAYEIVFHKKATAEAVNQILKSRRKK